MTAALGSQNQNTSAQGSHTTPETQPETLVAVSEDQARERLRKTTQERREAPPVAVPARGILCSTIAASKDILVRPAQDMSAADKAAEDSRRHSEWSLLSKAMGARYADCKLSSFEEYGTDDERRRQRSAIELCRAMSSEMESGVKPHSGLVLFGPPGTGKDHILAAMLRQACFIGHSVRWLNGLDFFGDMRDRMDKESPESAIIKELSEPDILAISDPLPPWGPLTAFQAQTLFRVIDRRYRQEKLIWVTINVAGSAEASERIGTAVVDRLKERALSVHCNWPSYRARRE